MVAFNSFCAALSCVCMDWFYKSMVKDKLAPLFYMKVLCNPFLCSHHDTVSSLDVPALHSHTYGASHDKVKRVKRKIAFHLSILAILRSITT